MDLSKVRAVLENQKEVQHLCYFLNMDDRNQEISVYLSTVDIIKIRKFRDENACIAKLIDILYELKKLEKWALAREARK